MAVRYGRDVEEGGGDTNGLLVAPPRPSIFQVFLHVVRFIAILDSLVVILCQGVILVTLENTWVTGPVYMILFCGLFVSSELQLEERIRCLPAIRSWIHRGFFYTFIAVLGYQQSTTLPLSSAKDNAKKTTPWIAVAVLQQASGIMYGLGVLYGVLGFFCVQHLRDRLQKNYDQERDDRERLRQHLRDRTI